MDSVFLYYDPARQLKYSPDKRFKKCLTYSLKQLNKLKDKNSNLINEKMFFDSFSFSSPIYQDINEIYLFLNFLIEKIKLEDGIFLEIGVGFGGTFLIWSKFFPNFIKIGIDIWVCKNAIDSIKERGISSTHFIINDSNDKFSIEAIDRILDGKKVDFLFIDASHLEKDMRDNFYNYLSFVKDGGVIAMHGINKNSLEFSQGGPHSSFFWEEIKNKYYFKEFIGNKDSAGLGALVK